MSAGSTTDRGYGAAHQKERARLRPIVNAGQAFCAQPICVMPNRWIQPGSKWALGHTDDRGSYLGPTHHVCNQRDGAIKGGKTTGYRNLRRRNGGSGTWHSRIW
jgi:hypothetical protein